MTEEVEAVEVNEAEDDAAFAAGFAEARGEQPPEPEAKPEPEVPAEQEVEAEVKAEETEPAPVEEPKVVAAGLTDEQLTSLLAKVPELENATADQIRKIHGKIGELQAAVKGSNGSGKARLVIDETDPLYSEYPEFAKLMAGLRVEGVAAEGSSFDPEVFKQQIDAAKAEAKAEAGQEMEMKLLTLQHRDWQQVTASDDFKVWQQTLDAATQKELNDSWDALYLGEKIGEFKSWRDRTKNATQERQKRLESAVVPQGTPTAPAQSLNDEDAFLAGYKAARGG